MFYVGTGRTNENFSDNFSVCLVTWTVSFISFLEVDGINKKKTNILQCKKRYLLRCFLGTVCTLQIDWFNKKTLNEEFSPGVESFTARPIRNSPEAEGLHKNDSPS